MSFIAAFIGTMVLFIFGIIIGFVIAERSCKKNNIGILRIDNSDPDDGPYLFLELNEGIDSFKNDKYVVLKVKEQNYISQK